MRYCLPIWVVCVMDSSKANLVLEKKFEGSPKRNHKIDLHNAACWRLFRNRKIFKIGGTLPAEQNRRNKNSSWNILQIYHCMELSNFEVFN